MVASLEEYGNLAKPGVSRYITFYGHSYLSRVGEIRGDSITILTEEGDVFSVISNAQKDGGVGKLFHDGFLFIPWPFASIVIKDGRPDETRDDSTNTWKPYESGLAIS